MRTKLRSKFTLLFMTFAVLLAIPAVALADDVSNNLDGSIDADVEATSVNTGSTKSVGYLVQPRNGDDQNGCNIQANESLTVNVASSNTAVATVSPSQLTFRSCGTGPSVTVTGVSPGTANITLTQASNNTGGKFNFATATFSVTVSNPTPPADTTAPTIDYILNPGVPDGSNGWYKSDVTLTWTVTDPESAVTKTGCVDQNITSDQAATTYSCSATSAGGSSGPVTVSIKRDATAPNFNCGTADAVWHATDVNIACTASDGGSGLADAANDASFNLSTSVANGTEDSNASTGSRAVLDNAGNSATAGPIAGNKIDKKAPSFLCDSADAVWHATNQTFSCTANDGGSGLTPASDANFSLSTTIVAGNETNNASTGTKTLTDGVGNTVTAPAITGVKVDMKAPALVSDGATSGPDGTNSWYTSAVTNGFTATDGGSGFAPSGALTYSFNKSSGTNEGAEVKIASGAVSDAVGNSTPSIDSAAFKIDLSDPYDVTFVGGPNAGGSYDYGTTPAAPTCTAKDAVSGMPDNGGCVVTDSNPGGFSATGPHTLTATATDNAGRTETATRSYTVAPYRLSGFYAPVDMGGVVNTVKGGSTVPLKFELFQSISGTELTDTSGITLTATRSTCDANAQTDAIEVTATGGTSLRYDSTGGQFIYNWKTPTGAGCYTVTMTAADGSTLTAYFKSLK